MTEQRPDPMTCPACGNAPEWQYDEDDQEWVLDAEWWYDPAQADPRTGFTCSRRCYLSRLPTEQPRGTP